MRITVTSIAGNGTRWQGREDFSDYLSSCFMWANDTTVFVISIFSFFRNTRLGTPRCPPHWQSVYESLFRDCQSEAVVWRPDHPVAMPFFPLPALLDQDCRLHRKQVDPPERVSGVDVAATLLNAGWSPLFTWWSSTTWFNLPWTDASLRRLRCNCRRTVPRFC